MVEGLTATPGSASKRPINHCAVQKSTDRHSPGRYPIHVPTTSDSGYASSVVGVSVSPQGEHGTRHTPEGDHPVCDERYADRGIDEEHRREQREDLDVPTPGRPGPQQDEYYG